MKLLYLIILGITITAIYHRQPLSHTFSLLFNFISEIPIENYKLMNYMENLPPIKKQSSELPST